MTYLLNTIIGGTEIIMSIKFVFAVFSYRRWLNYILSG